jgi:hypothetical protein
MLVKVLAAAGAAALLAGSAFAQSQATPSGSAPDASASQPAPSPGAAPSPDASATGAAPAPTGGIPSDSAGAAPSPSGSSAGSSGYNVRQPGEQASNTNVITNGPIPDTKENRARFGPPDSAAGRRTRPKGN